MVRKKFAQEIHSHYLSIKETLAIDDTISVQYESFHNKIVAIKVFLNVIDYHLSSKSLDYYYEVISDLTESLILFSQKRLRTGYIMLRSSLESMIGGAFSNYFPNKVFSYKFTENTTDVINHMKSLYGSKDVSIQYFNTLQQNISRYFEKTSTYVHPSAKKTFSNYEFITDVLNPSIDEKDLDNALIFSNKVAEEILYFLILTKLSYYFQLSLQKTNFINNEALPQQKVEELSNIKNKALT